MNHRIILCTRREHRGSAGRNPPQQTPRHVFHKSPAAFLPQGACHTVAILPLTPSTRKQLGSTILLHTYTHIHIQSLSSDTPVNVVSIPVV